MNNRERFLRVMRYQEVDHPPFMPENPWKDTLRRWSREGLPPGMDYEEYLGIDILKSEYAGLNTGPYPGFEERIISETQNEIIKTDNYGRVVKVFKDQTSMPEWLEFPVKNKNDLEKIIKEHFDLSRMEERWPEDWEEKLKIWKNPERDYIIFLDGGCYYGILRNLAGVEHASYLFYDAPELVEELFERINIICLEGLKRILPYLEIDYLGFGEDIAYKTSTLISPEMFERFLLPRYRKVVEFARKYGCDITLYDSDGNLNPFMELYFKAGINGFLPCEVAAGMDPVVLRKKYGKRIRMIGGIDKRVLSRSKEEIKKELMRKVDLIKEGGYIPKIDHSVSADIPWDNFVYYLRTLQEIYSEYI